MTPAVERLIAQRRAQGLPEKLTDPSALAKVAAILASSGGGRDARHAA